MKRTIFFVAIALSILSGSLFGQAQRPPPYIDTDTALAANSDKRVASQKAAKAYADTKANVQTTTLGSAVATITFTVPSGYTNLRIFLSGRSSKSAEIDTLKIQFNSDTGTNYEQIVSSFYGSTAPAVTQLVSQTSISLGDFPANTGTANVAGSLALSIPNYAGTTFYKGSNSLGQGRYTNAVTGQYVAGIWKNTAAITSIKLLLTTGNFMTGTVATLIAE